MPLVIPFTLRERSYNYKSQWNSVDRTCTKHRWNPIYNAEPIRAWSARTRPSRTRRTAEVDHRGSGTDFVWKNIGFSFVYLLFLNNPFRARFPLKFHRQLLHQHHLQCHLHCGNDPTITNYNGIPSATHPPAPLAIPFTLRERSYNYKSQWNSVDRTCTKHRWNPIYMRDRSEYDPPMIRAWSDHTRDRLAPVAPQREIIEVRERTLYGKI